MEEDKEFFEGIPKEELLRHEWQFEMDHDILKGLFENAPMSEEERQQSLARLEDTWVKYLKWQERQENKRKKNEQCS